MQKFLPRTSSNQQGFTLIELMVAITIVAILSIMGLVAFSTVQKSARDAKRRGDIDAIATALEANKPPTSSLYTALAGSQFSGGAIPTDPLNHKYCERGSATSTTAPAALTATGASGDWTDPTACPANWLDATATGTSGADFASDMSWTVCAALESSTAVYCKSSAQ